MPTPNNVAPPEETEHEVPLRDQRYFGSGLKRKRIVFVPSSSSDANHDSRLPNPPSSTVADRYRALVLKEKKLDVTPLHRAPFNDEGSGEAAGTAVSTLQSARCDVCGQPVESEDSASSHDSSIVHQICLKHSHPPSHIDRKRKGLAVLESHGWDPDSRTGLGSEGKGILNPVKARENPARAGLGVRPELVQRVPKPAKLDAGKVRLLEKESKKKADKLREAFYRSEDVLRYLGE